MFAFNTTNRWRNKQKVLEQELKRLESETEKTKELEAKRKVEELRKRIAEEKGRKEEAEKRIEKVKRTQDKEKKSMGFFEWVFSGSSETNKAQMAEKKVRRTSTKLFTEMVTIKIGDKTETGIYILPNTDIIFESKKPFRYFDNIRKKWILIGSGRKVWTFSQGGDLELKAHESQQSPYQVKITYYKKGLKGEQASSVPGLVLYRVKDGLTLPAGSSAIIIQDINCRAHLVKNKGGQMVPGARLFEGWEYPVNFPKSGKLWVFISPDDKRQGRTVINFTHER